MIVQSWDEVAPDGEIQSDLYIPMKLEFPLDEYKGGGRFYCNYLSSADGSHHPGEGRGLRTSLLEVVVEKSSGLLCRLVLVDVLRVRYQDYDPGQVVNGNPVFDIEATLGDRLFQRDRVSTGGEMLPSVDQYEQYELWVGGDRLTIMFEGRTTNMSIRTGMHLIVFVDEDQEVCGFQFTGITPAQRAGIIDSLTFKGTYMGTVIEGQDTFAG